MTSDFKRKERVLFYHFHYVSRDVIHQMHPSLNYWMYFIKLESSVTPYSLVSLRMALLDDTN